MIGEGLLNIIFAIVSDIFSLLPDISWSVDTPFFDCLISFIRMVGYLLPWETVTAICGLIVALTLFRIVVAFIKTIWDLLPMV